MPVFIFIFSAMAMSNKGEKKILTEEELQYLIDHLSEISEDEDASDVDSLVDPDYLPNDSDEEVIHDEAEDEPIAEQPCTSQAPCNSKSQKKRAEIVWKNKNLVLTEAQLKFQGNDKLPTEFLNMSSP